MRYVFVEIFGFFGRPQNDKNDKTANFSDFYPFYANFSSFRKTSGLEMLKTFRREQFVIQELIEKIAMQLFIEKLHQIGSEIDKNSKKYWFLKFWCNLCPVFDRLAGLEC